jgi:hypothetical protein
VLLFQTSDVSIYLLNFVRVLDLWDEDEIGPLRNDCIEIVKSRGKLVDPDHPFAGAEIDCSKRIADKQA